MQKQRLTIAVALALCTSLAHAQTGPAVTSTTDTSAARTLDTVSVIGQGETRQVQRINKVDKQVLPPGTSGQKILDKLPGVSVESNDAFGANEESQSITLRGFDKSRLGYTLDGIPLGDNSYGNFNGLSIARALIAENLGGAELSQGIGSLGTASTSNLGGAIQYFSTDPKNDFGVRFSQGIGTDHNLRSFLRVDSGDHRGFAAYISGVYQNADTWTRPYENQTTRQFNAKANYHFGDSSITAFAATSRVSQSNYSYLSKSALWRGLGWDWNIYAPDWNRALAAAYCAKATYNASKCAFSGGVNSIDDAYFKSRALRDDNLYALGGDFALAEGMRLKVQTYHHDNRGQGHWWAPGQKSNPGTPQEIPISIRSTNYSISRNGVTAALSWQLGAHELEAGLWYERNNHMVERNFYYIKNGPFEDDFFLSNPDRRLFHQNYVITTRQWYLQDRMHFLEGRLTVDVGVKGPNTTMKATSDLSTEGPYAQGTLVAKKSALPQVGVGYKFTANQEMFASYAQNIAAFQGGGASGPLAVSQAAFNATVGFLKPEQSKTVEAGFRSVGKQYQASFALYHTTFDNRLLPLNPCPSIEVGTRPECITRFINVGSVQSRGAELTFVLKPADGWQWYNALSLNKSTYRNNYIQSGKVVPVAGKITVDTPQRMLASELSYHSKEGWYASLRGKGTGKRYYTYTNDQSVPGFASFDAGAGYESGPGYGLKSFGVALNVTNLLNRRYAGQLSSFAPTDPSGTVYAIHADAPRQMFLTFSAEF